MFSPDAPRSLLILYEGPEGTVLMFLPCWMSTWRVGEAEEDKPEAQTTAAPCSTYRLNLTDAKVEVEPFATQRGPGR